MFPSKDKSILNNKKFSGKQLGNIFNHQLYNQFSLGKISEKKLVEKFIEDARLDLSADEFINFLKEDITIIDGMEQLLHELKKKYRLAAVVNEGKEWSHNKFEKSGFSKYFDWIFISGEIGLKKPGPKMSYYVLDKIKAKPEECIFIDDHKKNCDGARKFGFKTILFKNCIQLKEELAERGIKVI